MKGICFAIFILVLLNSNTDAKEGRGKIASPPSYNVGSNAYGWNFGSASKPSTSYGWNVGRNVPSAPVGPPPSYPGMQNLPVPSYNAPPAYSPSYNIRNGQRSGGSGFLTNALFYGAGTHSGYGWGRSSGYNNYGHSNQRRWNEEEDRRWRATTRAPYFENKVPGEDKILPASAVIGAATAFGLASLLPLNVPKNKPLIYCNNTDLMQSRIQINNEYIYQCINGSIEVSCFTNSNEKCTKKIMQCDLSNDEVSGNLYCKKSTLMSKNLIFCNSTTLLNGTIIINGTSINTTTTILNCYEGQVPDKKASFIPTTAATTERSLSFSAKAHMFFLRIIGKGDIVDQKSDDETWIPEALTIPHPNVSFGSENKPVSKQLVEAWALADEILIRQLKHHQIT